MTSPRMPRSRRKDLSDADVIAAIRAKHLQANVSRYPDGDVYWHRATVDPGGTVFGPGPYLKVPVMFTGEMIRIRVYAPAALRRRLAARWCRKAAK